MTVFSQGVAILDGITFFDEPNRIYLPVRDVANAFDQSAGYDKTRDLTMIDKQVVDPSEVRHGYRGRPLVALKALPKYGYSVEWNSEEALAELRSKEEPSRKIKVRNSQKRVVVDKSSQTIVGWQGQRVVFRSKVSTGIEGKRTPNGQFEVQDYRSKMHLSSLYDNAPMPWSVQVVGNIFIHGFKSVPKHPASHGCIRLPVSKAKWFYYWVDRGTPVSIEGKWS
jgi:lipoprotein-anchoring transpeptidase ErfK/SrfK